MENKKNLWQKLQEIQTQIKVSKNNSFVTGKGDKQKLVEYRGLDDILNELKPLLELTGLYMYQSDTITQYDDKYFVEVTTTIIDTDTGDSLSNTSNAEIDYKAYMNESQKTGSACTYARKKGLDEILGIAEDQDADDYEKNKENYKKTYKQSQATNQTQNAKTEATIDQKQLESITSMLKTKEDTAIANQVLKKAGYTNPKDIKVSDYVRIGNEIKRRLTAK